MKGSHSHAFESHKRINYITPHLLFNTYDVFYFFKNTILSITDNNIVHFKKMYEDIEMSLDD